MAAIAAPTGEAPLSPTEGYLIVQIDTQVPLDSVEITGFELAHDLPAGEHAWIVRVPAGRYDFVRVRPDVDSGFPQSAVLPLMRRRTYDASRVVEAWKDQFRFEVRAGAINYPGGLEIRKLRPTAQHLDFRHSNHAARAIRSLEARYGALLVQHPIVHGGPGSDAFLDHYTTQRDRLRRDAPTEPAR